MQFLIVLVIPLLASGVLGIYRASTRTKYANCSIPTLKNGIVDVRLNGRYVQFVCSSGFMLYGTSMSSCVYGQWENPIPICVASGCNEILSPPNGAVAFFQFGAKLTCNSKYELVGNDETFCDGKKWDRQIGSCRETNVASPLFCDFEGQSKCGWTNYLLNHKDWVKKNIGRHGTGPQHDHTKMKKFEGFFMVLEGYGPPYPKRSYLFSPMYSAEVSNDSCFKFYYHMYGVTPGIIRIFVKRRGQTNSNFMATVRSLYLLEIKNKSTNAWIEALVRLPKLYDMFQIVIEGEMMLRQRTDLAIDDVEILNGAACEADRVVVTARPTDEPGGVFDVQSCQYRCGGTQTTPSLITRSTCNCYDSCADDDTCCPDFEQFCIYRETTMDLIMYTTTNSPNTTTSHYMYDGSGSDELLSGIYTHKSVKNNERITVDTGGSTWLIVTCIIICMMIVGTVAGVYFYRKRTRVSTVADIKKHYHCKSSTEEFSEIGILTDDDDSSSLSGTK